MTNKKLNILFLSSWYPSKAHATLGNFVQRHAEAIALLHHVHVLYVTFLDEASDDFRIEEETIAGVKQTIVYCKPGAFKWWRKWNGFKKGIAHLREKGEFNFDLVHHNVTWSSGWQPLWLHRKFNLPYIITEHFTIYNTVLRSDQPIFLKVLSKFVAKYSSAICPVSDDLGNTMRHYGMVGHYVTVPNVVDTDLFNLKEKSDKPIRFLHVSSLWDEQKNISGILKAWKKAHDRNSTIHLTIGGDGDIKPWELLSEKLSIRADSIEFFTEKSPSEIATLMQQSHCLVLFSNFENLPVVIVEALASGVAVISTDVGGISEHIKEDLGYLIKTKDEIALTEIILKFASEQKKFDPTVLREYAIKHFDKKSITQDFHQVYTAVVR